MLADEFTEDAAPEAPVCAEEEAEAEGGASLLSAAAAAGESLLPEGLSPSPAEGQ